LQKTCCLFGSFSISFDTIFCTSKHHTFNLSSMMLRTPLVLCVAVVLCVLAVFCSTTQATKLVKPIIANHTPDGMSAPVFVETIVKNVTLKSNSAAAPTVTKSAATIPPAAKKAAAKKKSDSGVHHVKVTRCDKCEWTEDDRNVTTDSFDDADRERWMQDTDKKAKNIMSMLSYFDKHPLPDEQTVADSIAESQKLLHTYDTLKDKLRDVLMRRTGEDIRLPSEHPDFVDATGKHWADAEFKDNVHALADKFNKDAKKDQEAYQAELNRQDINLNDTSGGAHDVTVQVVPEGTLNTARSSETESVTTTSSSSSSGGCGCNTCSATCSCACSGPKYTPDGIGGDQLPGGRITTSAQTVPEGTVSQGGSTSTSAVTATTSMAPVAVAAAAATAPVDDDCRPPLCSESTSMTVQSLPSSSGPSAPPAPRASTTPTSKLKDRLQAAIRKASAAKKE
jgi:hypothetical protein